ncbi:hypothetical protein Acr_04g0006660 [Actinidia rufa]|uniref:Uncharacterized protein n=1 Tax=Actinidia rufa TaxID=165716 RepID=A0A7J0EHI1_9ERIC|nr:hypothetical protein Acr_04g0006660 [Actinidia rufa]
MVEAITSNQTHGGEADTSEGTKDKTRVAVSPIETRFTRVDVTVADSGKRLDIGEHSMEHEVGDLKGKLEEPRGNMQATVNSMVHVGQQGRLSFQLKVLDKGKPTDRKPKNNCFICDKLHFFRDCPKREELQARIKEYEERQRLEEEPTISEPEEDSTSTKVDRSKETVEVLEDFKDLVSLESPKGFPPKREVDHSIGLETSAKILATAPDRMAFSNLSMILPPKREVDHSIGLELRAKILSVVTTKSSGAFRFAQRRHEDNSWIFPKTVAIFPKKWRRERHQIWWGRMSRPAKRDRRRRGRHRNWWERMLWPAKRKKILEAFKMF